MRTCGPSSIQVFTIQVIIKYCKVCIINIDLSVICHGMTLCTLKLLSASRLQLRLFHCMRNFAAFTLNHVSIWINGSFFTSRHSRCFKKVLNAICNHFFTATHQNLFSFFTAFAHATLFGLKKHWSSSYSRQLEEIRTYWATCLQSVFVHRTNCCGQYSWPERSDASYPAPGLSHHVEMYCRFPGPVASGGL
jgi:hypothetical protein